MAWINTLLDGSFRGVLFQCDRIGRAGTRSLAVHEYAYVAGAEIEDMSLGPRVVRLRAVFYGDDYETELEQFIDALELPGVGELVHPVHGSMMVLAQGWEDEHDAEFVDGAIVNVTFVEDSVRELVFADDSASSLVDDIASSADAVRDAVDGGLAGVMDGLQGGLAGSLGVGGLGGLGGLSGLAGLGNLGGLVGLPSLSGLGNLSGLAGISGLSGIIGTVRGACAQVTGFIGGGLLSVTGAAGLLLSGLDPILYPRAYAGDLLAMIDRGMQGFSFGGRNRSYSSASTGASVSASIGTASAVPALSGAVSVISDFSVVSTQLNPARLVVASVAASASPLGAASVAVVQTHACAHMAASVAEAAAIVFAAEIEAPVLSPSEVEQVAGQTRAGIQVAIDAARATLDPEAGARAALALASLATAVQEAARAVINLRPPLTQRTSPVSGPLRLVAHAIYGDPARATEIASLNRLGRNVLMERGEAINAYSR